MHTYSISAGYWFITTQDNMMTSCHGDASSITVFCLFVENLTGTSSFLGKRVSNAQLCYFLCCYIEHAVKWEVESPMIGVSITLVWWHYNAIGKSDGYSTTKPVIAKRYKGAYHPANDTVTEAAGVYSQSSLRTSDGLHGDLHRLHEGQCPMNAWMENYFASFRNVGCYWKDS